MRHRPNPRQYPKSQQKRNGKTILVQHKIEMLEPTKQHSTGELLDKCRSMLQSQVAYLERSMGVLMSDDQLEMLLKLVRALKQIDVSSAVSINAPEPKPLDQMTDQELKKIVE
jgi:hypothetical protein